VRLSRKTLVLIDMQVGFGEPVWGSRNNPQAEENARALMAAMRAASGRIVHVRHLSHEAGSPLGGAGSAFKPGFAPAIGEALYEKSVNSAFIGTRLEQDLRAADAHDVIICGLTTPHCVSTTTRMAAHLGFRVELAHDACAALTHNADTSFDGGPAPSAEEIHRAAVYHLHGEFARAVGTADLIGDAG
jgi:nicotinamidase-related amidase